MSVNVHVEKIDVSSESRKKVLEPVALESPVNIENSLKLTKTTGDCSNSTRIIFCPSRLQKSGS